KWLEDNIAGWHDVALAPVELQHGSGWSADIFFIDVSYRDDRGPQERGLVVRRQGDSFDLVLGGDLEFQSKMLAALTRVGHLPVPQYVGIEPSSELLGAAFLIMERVPGRADTQKPNYIHEGWLIELHLGQRFDVWRDGIRAFDDLHKLDSR